MHPGLLDMLHHPADIDALAIAQGVEHRPRWRATGTGRSGRGCRRRPARRCGCSGPAARRRGRSPWPARRAHRRAGSPPDSPPGGRRRRPRRGAGDGVDRWAIFSRCKSCWNRSRSSARSMASGEVPRIGTPASSSGWASFSGVWPPNWTITPAARPSTARPRSAPARPRRSAARNRAGRRCHSRSKPSRIAVDHDRLDADLIEGEGRVAAAIVELDPWPIRFGPPPG